MQELIWQELMVGVPTDREMVQFVIRILIAMLVGAIIGLEREVTGKPAGLRTHMLVSLGSAMFVLIPLEIGLPKEELSRIIQGLATGVGFLGAGAIIKLSDRLEVQGLTTAATIWMTSALGMAVGLGSFGLALMGVVMIWFILAIIGRIQKHLELGAEKKRENLQEAQEAQAAVEKKKNSDSGEES